MKVENILNSKGDGVHAVRRDMAVSQAVEVLGNKNIGAVVVTETDGTVCGILSERDVVRHLSVNGLSSLGGLVGDCMTRNVVTTTKEAQVNELMTMMTARRIRHLPVVDNGKLAGIVSIGDVVKLKIEETEKEAASLREYIAAI